MCVDDDTDESLAMELLAGRVDERDGKVSYRYLDPGSDREEQAQRALVRLLRSGLPLSAAIRWRLSALLDPEHTYESRKFSIQSRRKGEQPNHARDLAIAAFLSGEIDAGRKLESAVEEAADRYGVSRATVMRAWKDHSPHSLN